MNILRYLVTCMSILVLVACDQDDRREEPKNTSTTDVDIPWSWIPIWETSRELKGELDEPKLKEWLREGLAPMRQRGIAQPIVRPDYWDSPWRHIGTIYRGTGRHKALRSSPVNILPRNTKPEIFQNSFFYPDLKRFSKTDYSIFKLKDKSIAFINEQTVYKKETYSADYLTLQSEYDKQALNEAIYSESIPMFLEHYGPKVLDGYSYGLIAEIRSCLIPKEIETLRGKDAEITKLLALLDEEEDMQSTLDKDGSRLYYCFRTSGGKHPIFTKEELGKRSTPNSKYRNWFNQAIQGDMELMPGSEHFCNIAEFIPEENFKNLINKHIKEGKQPMTLQKPFIEIGKVEIGQKEGKLLYDLVPILNTRHGTKIILAEVLALNPKEIVFATRGGKVDMDLYTQRVEADMQNTEVYEARQKILRERCLDYFDCEIRLSRYDTPALLKISDARIPEGPFYVFPLYSHQDTLYTIERSVHRGKHYLSSPHRDTMLCFLYNREYSDIPFEYGMIAWLKKTPKTKDKRGSIPIGL